METRTGGLIIAAPASGSGKTILTMGILRGLVRAGLDVAPFKCGPDYIDGAYLAAGAGRAWVNLDGWAMRRETLGGLIAELEASCRMIVGEGVMGLFDGAADGTGSTADLAALTGWPVVLVVDVRGQAASAAALVRGFAAHRGDVAVAGVIFNRVGGPRHAETLRRACADALGPSGPVVLGCVPREAALTVGERHLGLVQAAEQNDLARLTEDAARLVADHVDLAALAGLAAPRRTDLPRQGGLPTPFGQRIAVARDTAFAFAYPWLLEGWQRAGVEISSFSPLADEAPRNDADAVYLPGGYPELHGGRIAANQGFLAGLRRAARDGAAVYGECGGYMVLGQSLIDGGGAQHAMAGLLPHTTSFAAPRLHLGYRRLTLAAAGPLGDAGARFRGHEFHYAAQVDATTPSAPLFKASDAMSAMLAPMGGSLGRVCGSFAHLVDRADD